jgi:hypothetical protein
MLGFLKRVAVDRARGKRPAPPRAIGAAVVVGAAAGTIAYRVLRHERRS